MYFGVKEKTLSSMQHCETVQLLFLSDLTLKNDVEWCKLEDLSLAKPKTIKKN